MTRWNLQVCPWQALAGVSPIRPGVRVDEPGRSPHNRCISTSFPRIRNGPSSVSYQSIYRAGLFESQVVIVTGGGSGIGRCTAHELASLDATVALIGRTREKLDGVCVEIARAGGKTSAHVCDIREEETVKRTVADVLALHGKIDGQIGRAHV